MTTYDDTAQALKAAFDIGCNLRQEAGVQTPRPDGTVVLTVPDNTRDVLIPPLKPLLARAVLTMHDLASFTSYVNRFKSEATRIFASVPADQKLVPTLTAILDYHHPAQAENWLHRVTYQPRWSEQWQRWAQTLNGSVLKQVEFAELIEEARRDIHHPDAAVLLDVVRAFKAAKKVEFDSLVYQANGSVKLEYSEQVEQKGSSGSLPEVLKLGIPVFFRGTPFQVDCLVRYRLTGGSVHFNLKIDRPDVIIDEAFADMVKFAQSETDVEVYIGAPGAGPVERVY